MERFGGLWPCSLHELQRDRAGRGGTGREWIGVFVVDAISVRSLRLSHYVEPRGSRRGVCRGACRVTGWAAWLGAARRGEAFTHPRFVIRTGGIHVNQ